MAKRDARPESIDSTDSFEIEGASINSENSSTSELSSQIQALVLTSSRAEPPGAKSAVATAGGSLKRRPLSERRKTVRMTEAASVAKASALSTSLSSQVLSPAKRSNSFATNPTPRGKPPRPSSVNVVSASGSKPELKTHPVTPTASSGAKSFSDSLQVRDAVFSEWLAKKQKRASLEEVGRVEAKRKIEEEQKRKAAEKEERVAKAVEEWNALKEVKFLSKVKQCKEEATRKREQEKEKKVKTCVSELASQKWREESRKKLVIERKQKEKKVKEEEDRKQQDTLEKAKSSKQAFDIWRQKKDEVTKEQQRKQKIQENESLQMKREEAMKREQESKAAFDAWKGKKDDKIRTLKTLYTYEEDHLDKRHPQAWCPARSVKYTYPRTQSKPHSRPPSRSKALLSTRSPNSSIRSEVSSSTQSSTHGSRAGTPQVQRGTSTSKLKTIQVCCQTLEYWCTCTDDDS